MAARRTPSGGSKPDKLWRAAIMRAVKRRAEGEGDPLALEKLASKLIERGLEGDVTALKEIGDRLDGKPVQGTDHGGEVKAAPFFTMVLASPPSEDG